jgi:hypothetical protein
MARVDRPDTDEKIRVIAEYLGGGGLVFDVDWPPPQMVTTNNLVAVGYSRAVES